MEVPKFKDYQEEQKIVNFKVPASWRPKLKKIAKIYGYGGYSYMLRDHVGNLLRDCKMIKGGK